MDFPTFLIQLLNSVQYGLLLFMLAAGLTLIFGIMGVVNLAHGSFYMLGAYLAWSLSALFGSLTLAILVGSGLSIIFGLALEWLLFRHFYQRDHLSYQGQVIRVTSYQGPSYQKLSGSGLPSCKTRRAGLVFSHGSTLAH